MDNDQGGIDNGRDRRQALMDAKATINSSPAEQAPGYGTPEPAAERDRAATGEQPAGTSRRRRAAAAARSKVGRFVEDLGATTTPPETSAPDGAGPQLPPFAQREPTSSPTPLTTMRTPHVREDGGLVIRWECPSDDSATVLYRVVTSDRYPPYAPENGEVIAVTDHTEVVDVRPFTNALRWIQVWMNRGSSATAARHNQPELWCQSTAVAPVSNVRMCEDHGSVSGTWDATPPGIIRVEVLRVPEADAGRAGYLRQYLITEGQDCRTGFHDLHCGAGDTYEYRIFTVAIADGHETMAPVSRTVRVSAPLRPVLDLRATQRTVADKTVIDMSWTALGHARVAIYRTETGPEPGAEDGAIPDTALAAARLPGGNRLNHPVRTVDGVCHLDGVAWPDGRPRVFLTPVTLDQGQAHVGATRTLSRIGSVRDARLVPRGDWQLLTLSWPEGASQIQVFITPEGVPLAEPPGEPRAQLDRSTYEAQGGLRLRGVLPADSCDVHIVPASWYGGEMQRGISVMVRHRGLVELRYRFTEQKRGIKDYLFGSRPKRTLEVFSHQVRSTPRLILIHNDERLPLDARDGRQALVTGGPIAQGQWTALDRFQADPGKPGYLRLFADIDPATFAGEFAVLDPPVETLQGGLR